MKVLTNIAPDWGSVNGVVGPDHGIDELIEACECDPDHVVASSRVPRFKMPRQWDEDGHETEGSGDGEKRVSDVRHDSGRVRGEGDQKGDGTRLCSREALSARIAL